MSESSVVELTKEVPVTEYDELGVRIPDGDGVSKLEYDSSGELDAATEGVSCVAVNNGVIEASEVGLSIGVQLAAEVSEGEINDEPVAVKTPEGVEIGVWVPRAD